MRLVFTDDGWQDYVYWQAADRAMVKRINRCIEDIRRDPGSGIGKPEPLRHAFSGSWSRRIDDKHRLVYQVVGEDLIILKARFHYGR